MPKIIICHTLEHALDALKAASELDTTVTLQSAPDAILYAGGLYLFNMFDKAGKQFPQVKAKFIIDCGSAAAEAIAAIQSGHRHLRSSAPAALRVKISDIARQYGAEIITGNYEALDLHKVRDTKDACKKWLAGEL